MSLSRSTMLNGNATSTEADVSSAPIYFVSTHNTLVNTNINGIQSTINGLNAARQGAQPITLKPSFRKSPSLKDQLMYRPLCTRRVQKCGKNCIFCNYLHEGESIRLKNGKTVTCNGNFECTSSNIIYIATCSGCKKVTSARLEMNSNHAGLSTDNNLNYSPEKHQFKPIFTSGYAEKTVTQYFHFSAQGEMMLI